MFKKKIALLSLVSIISNFSLFTTNVLAYEIKENSKKIASTEVIKKDSSKNKKTSKAKKVITVAQNGNTHAKARDNLKMTYFGTDYQSTGIVAKPGEDLLCMCKLRKMYHYQQLHLVNMKDFIQIG